MTDIPTLIPKCIVPTLNRDEFIYRVYTGKPHGIYAGMYVMRMHGEPAMIYFNQLDMWVVNPWFHAWAVCSEKKYMTCHNKLDMERLAVGGYNTLAHLRLDGRVF
jgi:hypothetical protein